MMQFQAWWSNPKDPDSAKYLQWIVEFRQALSDVEGAVIHFADASLVSDPDAERVESLRYYYGDSLETLMRTDSKYDDGDLFSFVTSIPPSRAESSR